MSLPIMSSGLVSDQVEAAEGHGSESVQVFGQISTRVAQLCQSPDDNLLCTFCLDVLDVPVRTNCG